MTDQVPVVPADGAVAAAVDRPAVATVENNAQNANGNVVPATQPAALELEVSVSLVFFSLVLASALFVLVFAFVLPI